MIIASTGRLVNVLRMESKRCKRVSGSLINQERIESSKVTQLIARNTFLQWSSLSDKELLLTAFMDGSILFILPLTIVRETVGQRKHR